MIWILLALSPPVAIVYLIFQAARAAAPAAIMAYSDQARRPRPVSRREAERLARAAELRRALAPLQREK